MITTRGRRRHRTDNPGAFQENAIGFASPRIEHASTFLAIAVLGAYDAFTREFVAQQATCAIAIRLATGLGRHHASMRHGRGVANLIRRAIGILVTHALIHGAIAISTAAFRAVRARFTKFLHARGAATIAILDIAVVAAFIGFDDTIATSGGDTGIRSCAGIADIAHGAIRILAACAHVHLADTAGAFGGRCASLSKLQQTCTIAAVTGSCVAIVARFDAFTHAIATPRIDANVWRGNRIAYLAAGTIGIFVARTRGICHITETTGARHRAAWT